jgi:hypothetical protein
MTTADRSRGYSGWGVKLTTYLHLVLRLKADSHIECSAAKGLECVSHLIYTVRPCLIHACHAAPMPCCDYAVLLKATAVERRPVVYLPAFGFFRLLHGVTRKLLSEAYQSSSQRSIPTTVEW